MGEPRQLPLFSDKPQSEKDLNPYTEVQHVLPLFAEHLKQEGKSDNTIKAFIADLNLLIEHAGGNIAVGSVQTSHLNQFLDWMENERGVPCSRKTYARRVTSLKVLFKWLMSISAINHDPAKAVLQRSGAAPLSYALTPDEIDNVFAYAQTVTRRGEHDTRPGLLFWLLLDTGMKKNEIMRLTVDDVYRKDPDAPYLHVHHTVKNVYRERKVPIDPAWLDLFDEYSQQYKITDTVFTCTPRNLEYILTDLSNGADTSTRISFEIMRWTCAVRDTRNGMEADAIREKMGLSKVSWSETGRKVERLVEIQLEQEHGIE
jgi:site-specific recombinase XerD